ncbi:putative DNA-binding protein [Hathewaya massiliensis]|uniref:putative DNA-binding protein n=1 Tax=Hathewaya massiliensis TaxID=1964382 RepID=UPI0011589E18
MDKRTEILILFDIYGMLLTDKQKNIMDLYFNNDLSLSEIAENSSTSRQAIHDTIKRCEKLLYEYEKKLQLMNKSKKIKSIKNNIQENLKELNKLEQTEVHNIIYKIECQLKELN